MRRPRVSTPRQRLLIIGVAPPDFKGGTELSFEKRALKPTGPAAPHPERQNETSARPRAVFSATCAAPPATCRRICPRSAPTTPPAARNAAGARRPHPRRGGDT